MNTVSYTPEAGATSTLSPAPGDQFVMYEGTSDLYVPLSGDVYDPRRFVLTSTDGTKYLIDRDTGLVTATTADGKTLTVTKDGIASSQGPAVTFDRDTQGRITTVTGPTGATRHYTYDTNGDLVGYTNGQSQHQSFAYDTEHRLSTVPGGGAQPSQTFGFDADGRVASITDANGHTTQVSFDLGAHTRTVTSPAGDRTTVTEMNPMGDPVTQRVVADGKTAVTSWTRDDAGRPLTNTDPDGHTTTNVFDAKGNLTSATDGAGVTTTTSYNAMSEPVDTTVAGVVTEHREYDTKGHLLADKTQGRPATTYTWAGGQPVTMTDPTGAVTTLGYNLAGYLGSISSAAGTITRITDTAGKVQGLNRPGSDGDSGYWFPTPTGSVCWAA
jgi:YD repeat-containing protein